MHVTVKKDAKLPVTNMTIKMLKTIKRTFQVLTIDKIT